MSRKKSLSAQDEMELLGFLRRRDALLAELATCQVKQLAARYRVTHSTIVRYSLRLLGRHRYLMGLRTKDSISPPA